MKINKLHCILRSCISTGILLFGFTFMLDASAERYLLKGSIGQYPIVMLLRSEPTKNTAFGSYFYQSSLIPILIEGNNLKHLEEKIPLEKLGNDYKTTGIFSGKLVKGTYQGQWSSINRKTHLPFKLSVIAKGQEPVTDGFKAALQNAIHFNKSSEQIIPSTELVKVSFSEPNTKIINSRIKGMKNKRAENKINAFLNQKHKNTIFNAAAECFSEGSPDVVTYDGYNDWQWESQTQTLLEISYSGSVYCGGAHPTNYYDLYQFDQLTGAQIEMNDLFDLYENPAADPWEIRIKPEFAKLIKPYFDELHPITANHNEDELNFAWCLEEESLKEGKIGEISPRLSKKKGHIAIKFINESYATFVCETENIADIPLSVMKPFATPKAIQYFPSLR